MLDEFYYGSTENARVMVLAATNRPSELDEAILRRLPQAFEIGTPNKSGRAEILKVILKGENVEDNIDYDHIASLCEGYTGSDLLELCKKAAYFAIRDLLDEEKKGKQSNVSYHQPHFPRSGCFICWTWSMLILEVLFRF